MRRRVITGHRERGEHAALVAALRAPRDLAAGALLGLVGDLHALLAGVLAEALDAGLARGGPGGVVGVLRVVGLGEAADHEDLFPVGRHLGRLGEPVVGQPPGEPAGQILGLRCCSHTVITSLLAM